MARRMVVVMILALSLGGCGGPSAEPSAAPSPGGPAARVLVFTRTAGYRHESIPAGIDAVRELGATGGYTVDATEDPGAFRASNLARYRAVVFLSTSGDVLDETGKRDLEEYVRGGGGYVGVHAASTTEYGWPFYGELVGAWFARHPAIQPGRIVVEDRTHPATAHLDTTWSRTDEWYDFRTNPRGRVHVLLTVDESSYSGGGMGRDHPIAWCHAVGTGRAFYTALGHAVESFAEPAFRDHLRGAIRWAARLLPARCADESPAAAATGLSLPGPGEAPDFHFYSGNE